MAGAPPTHMRSRRFGSRLRDDPTPSGTAPPDGGLHVPASRGRGKSRQDYSGSSISRGVTAGHGRAQTLGVHCPNICRPSAFLRRDIVNNRQALDSALPVSLATVESRSSNAPAYQVDISSDSVLEGERSKPTEFAQLGAEAVGSGERCAPPSRIRCITRRLLGAHSNTKGCGNHGRLHWLLVVE